MARKLRSVKLDEISFVGKGDNPEAHVLLLKIKPEDESNNDKGENEMTPEEIAALQKAIEDGTAKIAELEKQIADVTKEKDDLIAKASKCPACGADMEEGECAKGCGKKEVKKEEEDIFKGLPEAIVKEIQDNRARIAKMEDETSTREYVAKAAEVTLIGKADEVGDLLKSIAKHSTDLATKVFDLFKTASVRIKEGDLLKEIGKQSDDSNAATAYDKIVAKAAELRKAHPELTEAKAFTKVYDEDAELRAAYLKERN